MRAAEIARALDSPQNDDPERHIQEYIKDSAPMQSTVITKKCGRLIVQIEKLLIVWPQDQNKCREFRHNSEKARRL